MKAGGDHSRPCASCNGATHVVLPRFRLLPSPLTWPISPTQRGKWLYAADSFDLACQCPSFRSSIQARMSECCPSLRDIPTKMQSPVRRCSQRSTRWTPAKPDTSQRAPSNSFRRESRARRCCRYVARETRSSISGRLFHVTLWEAQRNDVRFAEGSSGCIERDR